MPCEEVDDYDLHVEPTLTFIVDVKEHSVFSGTTIIVAGDFNADQVDINNVHVIDS